MSNKDDEIIDFEKDPFVKTEEFMGILITKAHKRYVAKKREIRRRGNGNGNRNS